VLNPIIYSLRNKDVKGDNEKIIKRNFHKWSSFCKLSRFKNSCLL
jgi:hypothetical protein